MLLDRILSKVWEYLRPVRRNLTDTYAGAKGCRAVAAAAAASGPGFLASARAAAPVGKVALAAPTRPRCIATPLSAAAVTTHTRHARTCTITQGLPWRLTLLLTTLKDSRLLLQEPRRTSTAGETRFAAWFHTQLRDLGSISRPGISSSNVLLSRENLRDKKFLEHLENFYLLISQHVRQTRTSVILI